MAAPGDLPVEGVDTIRVSGASHDDLQIIDVMLGKAGLAKSEVVLPPTNERFREAESDNPIPVGEEALPPPGKGQCVMWSDAFNVFYNKGCVVCEDCCQGG